MAEEDFKMVYYNADGNTSSMCGNGGRCIVAFARFLGIIEDKALFTAVDGQHEAIIDNDIISLKMQDVEPGSLDNTSLFLDTGSPHHILFTENLEETDVKKEGAKIRYSEKYVSNKGTNVNFVQEKSQNTFMVRTYERGVEDETYSCGTGVTAVALAVHATGKTTANTVKLETPGGRLTVSFERTPDAYRNIWLTGPTEKVFRGEIEC
jgi:diaminopimelate epimerase